MIHYKDRAFCINPNCTCPEGRKYTPEVQAAADRWWNVEGKSGPVAMSDLCGTDTPTPEKL